MVHSYTDMAIFVLKEVKLCSSSTLPWLTSSLELRAHAADYALAFALPHHSRLQREKAQVYLLQSSARTCMARGERHRQAGPHSPAHPPVKSGPTVMEVTIWVTCICDVKTTRTKQGSNKMILNTGLKIGLVGTFLAEHLSY